MIFVELLVPIRIAVFHWYIHLNSSHKSISLIGIDLNFVDMNQNAEQVTMLSLIMSPVWYNNDVFM